MKNYSAKNIDEYIKNAPEGARNKMLELRAVIKSAIPKADEVISWGIPFYKYHGYLAGFSAFKKHISFGFMAVLENDIRERLEAKGYITSKKIIQIKFAQKIPVAEIRQILKAQIKINEVKKSK